MPTGPVKAPYPVRSTERESDTISCDIALGNTGAVSAAGLLSAKRAGFSIARDNAGIYTVTFQRKWKRLKWFSITSAQAAASAGLFGVITTAYSATAGTLTFTLVDATYAAAEAANSA